MSRLSRRGVNAKRLAGGGVGLSKAASLTDDFRTLNTGKWSSNVNASVVGWRGRVTMNSVGGAVAGFGTGNTKYDLTNSYMYVEFATLPTHNTSSVYLMARLDVDNLVFIGREGANLLMRQVAAGVVSDTTLTYDYTYHRWKRLRHDGTSLLFETSNNWLTWTTRRTLVPGFSLASIEIRMEALWLGSVGVGRAEFGWFNTAPVTAL